MKDMLENGLDLRMQGQYISFCDRKQKLKLENYIIVHRLGKNDINYDFYTVAELRTLQQTFGHPRLTTLQELFKRTIPG